MGSLDAFAVLALLSFVACLASSIIILWRHALVFAYNGAPLLAVADELGDDDVRHAYRVANVWMQPDLNRNGTTIANLSSWFSASCVTLAAEVLLWTVSIAR